MNSLQRKYIRGNTTVPSNNFYTAFRNWLDEYYSGDVHAWDVIMDEDSSTNYSTIGSGIVPQPRDSQSEMIYQGSEVEDDHFRISNYEEVPAQQSD